jgi:hypothetical protein
MVQPVSNVKRATRPLDETSPKQAIEKLVISKVEACSEYQGSVVASPYHPFVAAVDAAFCGHRPLVLSPDMFWLLIGQGFARHVNTHAEDLRQRFVTHVGKQSIVVRRDDFFKGSPDNPWSEVFSEFSLQIRKRIGAANHSNIVATFSTTGPVEKAANEIVLMDSIKNYFKYEVLTLCGIPDVALEGTADDWRALCDRTRDLGDAYDLAWWTDRLVPTLERIAHNAAGSDDPQLWKNIYKINHESGGPYINGWITDFFPYLQTSFDGIKRAVFDARQFANKDKSREKNIETRNWLLSDRRGHGITTQRLPGSLCKAPFTWQYLDRTYNMEFLAGFIGFTQETDSLAVRPKIGWAVREA